VTRLPGLLRRGGFGDELRGVIPFNIYKPWMSFAAREQLDNFKRVHLDRVLRFSRSIAGGAHAALQPGEGLGA